MKSGPEFSQAVAQLQDWSVISLLKVILTSYSPGGTSLLHASGTVLTTTGAKESMSCARTVCVVKPHSALAALRVINVFVFMFFLRFIFVWSGKSKGKAPPADRPCR